MPPRYGVLLAEHDQKPTANGDQLQECKCLFIHLAFSKACSFNSFTYVGYVEDGYYWSYNSFIDWLAHLYQMGSYLGDIMLILSLLIVCTLTSK